jgi:hypothetical protein
LLKLQQFWILKFNSNRLKKARYKINISLDDARKNGEIITINNSEMIRTLFRLKNIKFSQDEIDSLLYQKKKTKRLNDSIENRNKLKEIEEKIESILFQEDFISIEFDNKAHYKTIIKNKGFYVNGIKYTPFMASAGMIRKNTALFINNNYKYQLIEILENGRNRDAQVVPAKLGAYFSLYSSSTLPVSFPKFAVIKDKEINTIKRVDFVTYVGENEDDKVEEIDYEMIANAFDGQGLITPRLAEKWSKELSMDYTFSTAIIRAPFLKGMVAVFDLEKFANEVAGNFLFTDIYGSEHDIRDIDLIVSESMFKLWSSYGNTEDYVWNCHKNNFDFSIAKVNPNKEKVYSKTSYQYLQVLNLNEVDVANLCEPTVSWFRNISGGDANSMILYATGEHTFDIKDFDKMELATKAVMINPELARDKYVQNKFIKTIEKKKKESYMGGILINANYSIMIADPYYQACYMFGLDKEPLLKEGEHYSYLWLSKGMKEIIAVRSPIVHHSEVNSLHIKDSEEVLTWYEHLKSGIVFPANGIGMDFAIHGGADVDGDLVCTINNPIMRKGKVDGLPILYESRKAIKSTVDLTNDEEQSEGQLMGYNSKVGFATNISSSMYTMLEEFPRGTPEHKTLLNRLKIGRVIQGEIIDGVKGLQVPPFRSHWTKWKHIDKHTGSKEQEKQEFYNKIVCEKRPSFFRFLYSHYMTRYNKEIRKYDLYSRMKFNETFDGIVKKERRTEEEEMLYGLYRRKSYFLDNNSVVNKLSRYMRTSLGLINKYSNKSSRDFDYNLLLSKNFEFNEEKFNKIKILLNYYTKFKRGMWHDSDNHITNLDAFISYLKKLSYDISSNDSELANYAVLATYGDEVSKVDFAWKIFPQGIIENIISNSDNKIQIPVADEDGTIEYLWNKYSIKEFSLEDIYEVR